MLGFLSRNQSKIYVYKEPDEDHWKIHQAIVQCLTLGVKSQDKNWVVQVFLTAWGNAPRNTKYFGPQNDMANEVIPFQSYFFKETN